jgi:protein-S-isoprenylcysteine O-methyltransferase Ste14
MLATLLPTLAIVEFGVIHREERYLARQFGAEYESYRSRTRRWL